MYIEYKQLFHWRLTFRKGREIACCKRLIAGVMMFAASAAASAVGPTGFSTGGGATVDQTNINQTVIDQSAGRVDINWTSFDTDVDHTVRFDQPNALALAINRISGNRNGIGGTTLFDGTLKANGRIFLINQNGITFGSGSQVNVGSLLATTSDLKDDEIEDLSAQGRNSRNRPYEFQGEGYAEIINNGTITISNGGFAVLAAPYVENNHIIRADYVPQVDDYPVTPSGFKGPRDRQGQIELVSTDDATNFRINVDLRGDGLITFDYDPRRATQAEDGENGDRPTLGVTNNGLLQSKSGHIYLTARKATKMVESVINLGGVVDADQFEFKGDNGDVVMVASGPGGYNNEPPGGTIKVQSDDDINIAGGADIHAVGGEQVSASFEAKGDINMGAEGDPAKITLHAYSGKTDDDMYARSAGFGGSRSNDANAEAELVMIAKHGSLNIVDGVIEVSADAGPEQTVDDNSSDVLATSGFGASRDNNARAVATALLEGEQVDINADITVTADARATASDVGMIGFDLDPVGVASATHSSFGSQGTDGAEAIATLDVLATGGYTRDYEVPNNLVMTGDSNYVPGNLDMKGDITVDAKAVTEQPGIGIIGAPLATSGFGPGRDNNARTAKATANTVLVATGDLDVAGDINVNAEATSSQPGFYGFPPIVGITSGCRDSSCNGDSGKTADANAALLMLGGAPRSLPRQLQRMHSPGTLSDLLTDSDTRSGIVALAEKIAALAEDSDPRGEIEGAGGNNREQSHGFGSGGVTYTGDINVTSVAESNGGLLLPGTLPGVNISGQPVDSQSDVQATAAAVIAGGGDVYIDTDPIRVKSLALTNYAGYPMNANGTANSDNGLYYPGSFVDTEARSLLVFAAGLGDLAPARTINTAVDDPNGNYDEMGHSDLTILGDVSARAYESPRAYEYDLERLTSNVTQPYPDDPSTIAVTALLATGDITVRGADPLAEAGPLSDTAQTALAQGRSSLWEVCDMGGCTEGEGLYPDSGTHVAQLIIEAGGDIDIQPKTKTQPSGLFLDPVGPGWPGDKPLRFDANGQMLVATGADATRPPRFVALGSDVEAAILAGADPSTLLPPTASGGCVAAGRDAFTVSDADYFDRMISSSCESK